MACVPAPACKQALAQATLLWPQRSRASDGICSSPTHQQQNPNSDHDIGNAFDLTHDPANGVDCNVLAQHVIKDSRIRYVIWNRQIFNPSISMAWRTYSGPNPHTKHMHVSIKASVRADTRNWWPIPDQEDDDMAWTDEQIAEVLSLLRQMNHQLSGDARLKAIASDVDRIADKVVGSD